MKNIEQTPYKKMQRIRALLLKGGSITLFSIVVGMLCLGVLSLMAAAPAQRSVKKELVSEQPIIKKLSKYSGSVFKNFAEFRVQRIAFDRSGIISLQGKPFEMLVNCTQIVMVQRFTDGRDTDYSSLMFIAEDRSPKGIVPILIREEYKEILKRMKRAIESRG
jgi:hypothetical protein